MLTIAGDDRLTRVQDDILRLITIAPFRGDSISVSSDTGFSTGIWEIAGNGNC
jgi:hypothetical protein